MRRIAAIALALLICSLLSDPARAWDPLQKARRAAEKAGKKLEKGDVKAAIEDYARAQAYRPQDPDYRLGLGEALYADGDLKGAMGQFLAAANADDPRQDMQALYNAGNVALAKKDPKTALSLYQKALLQGKPDADLLHNLELAQRMLEAQKNQKQKSDQNQNQKSDQSKDQNSKQDQEQKSNPEQGKDQQQDQQQNQPKQDQSEQQSKQDQQDQTKEQQKEQQSAAADSTAQEPSRPDSTQTAISDSMTTKVGVMSPAEALRLLSALDHDEEELRRSIQRRLRKTENKSKHEW